ncbi:MAG TPA: SCO family protein [Thiobacillaceae bacterium]|nr:SCO family protein [Thiobacillaceae bacterium]HNU63731.1 SCO family protein [Thiobacillaceae bacterium]
MWRTVLCSVLLLVWGYVMAVWLTHDFQVWTDEGARRLEVALRPVQVPSVRVQGPTVEDIGLDELLSRDGGATIVDFFYTHCRSVCLSVGGGFRQLQTALRADHQPDPGQRVRLLSISFDGARDDPAVLRAYAHGLGADPALWRFVRVRDAAQQELLLHRLGVVVIADGLGDYEHNASLLVFDQRGRMRRIFDPGALQTALDYARHLARAGR